MRTIVSKRNIFLYLSLIVLTAFSFNVQAQSTCSSLFEDTIVRPAELSPEIEKANSDLVSAFQKVSLTRIEKNKIDEIIRPYKIGKYKDVTDLATQLADKISTRFIDQVQQGAELSKVGNNIYDKLEVRLNNFFTDLGLTKDKDHLYNFNKSDVDAYIAEKFSHLTEYNKQKKKTAILEKYNEIRLGLLKVRYNFAEQVSRLEQFQLSEYQPVTTHPLANSTYTLISLGEYPEFAMALAKREAPPKPYGSGGVLGVKEYRDIIATNLWLFTLNGHDLKHIHFGHAHPMATAAFFRSTRSKNHLRFFLMAGAYEGVDTVQYSYENRLAQHFSNKGYSLENAMLYIATAPQAELVKIAKIIGVSEGNLTELNTWKPSLIPLEKLPLNAKPPEKLEQEIKNFMARSISDLTNPAINIFMRPELVPDGIQLPAGTSNKPGEDIHY